MQPYSNKPKLLPIGPAFTAPLVSIPHIKAHLSLLHAFGRLKKLVERSESHEVVVPPTAAGYRWAWFELWCKWSFDKLYDIEEFLKYHLPPIDVFMVWHSHSLNPAWYQEDVKRVSTLGFLENVSRLVEMHFEDIVSCLLSGPSDTRISEWTNATQLPFDPIESTQVLITRMIICPNCRKDLVVPLSNEFGTGYLQPNFSARCSNSASGLQCPEINKARLAARKLAKDLSTNGWCDNMEDYQKYIAGTLYTQTDPYDFKKARYIKDMILDSAKFRQPNGARYSLPLLDQPNRKSSHEKSRQSQEKWELSILRRVEFSTDLMHRAMRKHMPMTYDENDEKLLSRIMGAYADDKPWSIDLVAAVLRQGSFIKRMKDLGWTEASFLEAVEGEHVLKHSVLRYHAFLDLLYGSPDSFFVPTLDIDLVWHTHQLMASKYRRDCMQFLNRFLDHNDQVAKSRLSSAFKETCQAWKRRFNTSYTNSEPRAASNRLPSRRPERELKEEGRDTALDYEAFQATADILVLTRQLGLCGTGECMSGACAGGPCGT
ncbi:hypothetical protein WG66_000714 [Moniliophthora roreri]|uniref:Uncharacterized protein n=1 Tax=Moniliophthora roreri TaxID=221103 RepID=A0A0W0FLT0_MONRR|nr:hypothetical protein WG66_000714 [Moniliophthora roreri]